MGLETGFDENSVIFDKSCTCPVCDNKFTYRAVKTGKARLLGTDPDLRPKYDKFDPLKYDIISCTKCGYSATSRYFDKIASSQAKTIMTNMAGKNRGINNSGILSYDDAIMRHQLALACAVVKKGKISEKAYTCLKMAWCIRGKKESYPFEAPDYDLVINKCRVEENNALKAAYEGFKEARGSESFPIAGMDEHSFDYLLAELANRFDEKDFALRLISSLLVNSFVSSRIKDKCRDLKERIKIEKEME